ncbi:hypothetical protein PF006_g7360 [Phytophthora fragariae]|uniref:Uncharacterized protein n=1 Tax=Phytophthora fragariae TaxID=53985 RepID=A0A6A3U9T0_9STRA|nr:hypothetical protein PF006_g7360 [Phytophthora fragariae]
MLSNQVMMHLQHRNESWVAEQPSVVDRQDYPTPRKIITRATKALTSGDECRTTSVEQNGLAPAVTDDLAGPGVHKPSVMVQEDALGHDDGEPTSSEDSNAYGPTADSRGSDDGGISPIDEDPSCNEADATDTFKHRPNETKPMENLEIETNLTGYGDKSAFIPDSSETMLTYSEPIGQSRSMDAIQREILITNVPTPP